MYDALANSCRRRIITIYMWRNENSHEWQQRRIYRVHQLPVRIRESVRIVLRLWRRFHDDWQNELGEWTTNTAPTYRNIVFPAGLWRRPTHWDVIGWWLAGDLGLLLPTVVHIDQYLKAVLPWRSIMGPNYMQHMLTSRRRHNQTTLNFVVALN